MVVDEVVLDGSAARPAAPVAKAVADPAAALEAKAAGSTRSKDGFMMILATTGRIM